MRAALGLTTCFLIGGILISENYPSLETAQLSLAIILACILETASVRLPYLGTVSFGLVIYLPLLFLPNVGPLVTMGVACIGIMLRESWNYSIPSRLADEIILDLLPLSLTSLVVMTLASEDENSFLLWLSSGLTFITTRHVVIQLLTRELDQGGRKIASRLQSNTADIRWGLLGMSVITVILSRVSLVYGLAIIPLIISLRRAAIHAYAWLDTEDKRRLRREAGQLSQSLMRAEARILDLSDVLETTESERDLLEALSRETSNCGSLTEMLVLIEKLCQSLRLGKNVELFVREPENWLSLRCDETRRTRTKRLKFEDIGGGSQRAWKRDKWCFSKKTGRIFYPLPGFGVISFSPLGSSESLDQGRGQLFASQVMLACLSARRFEMVTKTLNQLEDLNNKLSHRNERLVDLALQMKNLSSCNSLSMACQELPVICQLLVGHEALEFVTVKNREQFEFEWWSSELTSNPLTLSFAVDQNYLLSVGLSENCSSVDEEFLEVGLQCIKEILGQFVLSGSLQQALEQLTSSEAQLVQSAKLAAVGQLSAGLAHEINNPLGSIRLAIDVALRKETLSPLSSDLLTQALSGVKRAENITSSLLSYSRSGNSGTLKVNAQEVIDDACKLLQSMLKLEEVRFLIQNDTAGLSIVSNPQDIQQIITNLIVNSKDAVAERKDATIELKAQISGHKLTVEVHDNGPGVPASVVDKVFDPFFTTKPVGKGTGLGLSVSRELTQKLGGSLSLEKSELWGGACFVLSLPGTCQAS